MRGEEDTVKSDIITVDNRGNGFSDAMAETLKAASYVGLDEKKSLRLQLITEEMLSMARSITGEMKGKFWLESEETRFILHLSTKTVMDKEKRSQLINAATSRQNEAAGTFLGRLRDAFEQAMAADVSYEDQEVPRDLYYDLPNIMVDDSGWDGYERSVLRRLADNVKIGIRGGHVDMTVSKDFAE